jgi:hypothetical protein
VGSRRFRVELLASFDHERHEALDESAPGRVGQSGERAVHGRLGGPRHTCGELAREPDASVGDHQFEEPRCILRSALTNGLLEVRLQPTAVRCVGHRDTRPAASPAGCPDATLMKSNSTITRSANRGPSRSMFSLSALVAWSANASPAFSASGVP